MPPVRLRLSQFYLFFKPFPFGAPILLVLNKNVVMQLSILHAIDRFADFVERRPFSATLSLLKIYEKNVGMFIARRDNRREKRHIVDHTAFFVAQSAQRRRRIHPEETEYGRRNGLLGASVGRLFGQHGPSRFAHADDKSKLGNFQKENGTVSSGADADDDFVELPPLCGRDPHQTGRPEPALVLFFEVLFPFLVAGLGMVFAGLVFDKVQHWSFYREAPQALILVPALLGLKGNLEMTLASRLSTQSNIGKMDSREQIYATVVANIALIETQAIVVTILATATAMAFAWIPRGDFDWGHAVLVGSAALTTASVASLVLSGVMVAVILVAKRYQVNPDNVAAPIAASMGDLTTLAVLSMVGNIFLSAHRTQHWLSICSILFFLMLLPACAIVAWRDANARQVLRYGWSPIIFSMMISSSGGFVLERAMRNFRQMALYQPVMNGVGGNLAAVAASKLSTFYHRTATLGTLPNEWSLWRFCSVTRAFFSADEDSRAARVLLMLCVPGHMLFNWVIFLLHSQSGDYVVQGPLFSALYLTAALGQVTILLFLCQWLVPLMWLWRQNPDNAAIPYLTAMGDLLGTSFLFTAFSVLALLKPEELVSVLMSSTTTTTPLPPTAMPPG